MFETMRKEDFVLVARSFIPLSESRNTHFLV